MGCRGEGMSALEIRAVHHDFGTLRALHDIHLTIEEGQFVALLGLNGAGKTTLFSLMTRLFMNQSGTIRLFDHDLHAHARAALAAMGVVFQLPSLDLDLSIEQNLHYHGALHGMNRSHITQRMEAELARIGLSDVSHKKIRHLSGGQRRRVEIARALLHQPRFLLLDEPTVGLDMESRRIITDHIHQLCRQQGLSVLWATHLFDEVADDDHLVILHKGKIKMTGLTKDLLRQHQCQEVKGLFDHAVQGEA